MKLFRVHLCTHAFQSVCPYGAGWLRCSCVLRDCARRCRAQVTCAAVSSAADSVVSGSADGSLIVYALRSGQARRRPRGRGGAAACAAMAV
eukprot:6196889-Pleurochrysis_carterae.AAC.3